MSKNTAEIPVFILCGGLGTRIKVSNDSPPKPMNKIGNHPILFHIIRYYHKFGFRRFVLCAGYKYEVIVDYFNDLLLSNSNVTFNFNSNTRHFNDTSVPTDLEVTVVDTGKDTMTGGRVARAIDKFLGDSENFALTYGDGLCDVDLSSLLKFHIDGKKIGTVLGVNPPSQFGKMDINGELVHDFLEKPKIADDWINGGFFFFNKQFRKYLSTEDSCILEQLPLSNLAKDGELKVYKHLGFWQCMDTYKDWELLNKEFDSGNAKWI
jgi:glucose-1-phosphate cytidylyltransferase